MKNNFIIQSWDEAPYLTLDTGAKYSRASIQKKYSGELEGQGQLDYLMAYTESGKAVFTGIEHFEGSVGGLKGTFSILHEGIFENGSVASTFRIIDNSASNELIGICGSGAYNAGHSMSVDFDFDCNFSK